MNRPHWQDGINFLLGIGLCASPWAFGYVDQQPVAAWNAVAAGIAIAAIDAYAIYRPREQRELLNLGLAVWLLASPWILGFSENSAALVTALMVGVLTTELSVWVLSLSRRPWHWWQLHH